MGWKSMNPWIYDTHKFVEKSVLLDKSINEAEDDYGYKCGEVHAHATHPDRSNQITDRTKHGFGHFEQCGEQLAGRRAQLGRGWNPTYEGPQH